MKQDIDHYYNVQGYDDIYNLDRKKGNIVLKKKLSLGKGRSTEPQSTPDVTAAEQMKKQFAEKLTKQIKNNIISNTVSKKDNFKQVQLYADMLLSSDIKYFKK